MKRTAAILAARARRVIAGSGQLLALSPRPETGLPALPRDPRSPATLARSPRTATSPARLPRHAFDANGCTPAPEHRVHWSPTSGEGPERYRLARRVVEDGRALPQVPPAGVRRVAGAARTARPMPSIFYDAEHNRKRTTAGRLPALPRDALRGRHRRRCGAREPEGSVEAGRSRSADRPGDSVPGLSRDPSRGRCPARAAARAEASPRRRRRRFRPSLALLRPPRDARIPVASLPAAAAQVLEGGRARCE